MTPFADWPVRPRAKRGESLAGYVYRVHSENGHSLSPSAYQLVKACYCGTQTSMKRRSLAACPLTTSIV